VREQKRSVTKKCLNLTKPNGEIMIYHRSLKICILSSLKSILIGMKGDIKKNVRLIKENKTTEGTKVDVENLKMMYCPVKHIIYTNPHTEASL